VPVFTGILDREVGEKGEYNGAILITGDGKIVDYYRKNHLVPFGEWFPYKKYFPFIAKILEETWAGDFTPSDRKTVFRLKLNQKKINFSCLICYEGVFSELVRLFVLNGAEILINITNDMWSYSRRAEYQHAIADIFRSIENRVAFVRASNSGVTCVVNQYGKIVKELPLFKEGYLLVDVPYTHKKIFTLYKKFGNYFPYLIFVLMVIVIVKELLTKIKKNSSVELR